MTEKRNLAEDGVSWMDVYLFILRGWRILLGCALVGLVVGLTLAFFMPRQPERVLATAMIESATVAHRNIPGSMTTASFYMGPLQSGAELFQKMHEPGFYSVETLQACGLEATNADGKILVGRLNPQVSKNPKFVSVSFLASSQTSAKTCLQSVLRDVIINEEPIRGRHIKSWEDELRVVEQSLQSLEAQKNQILARIDDRLISLRSRLKYSEEFVSKYSLNTSKANSPDYHSKDIAVLLRNERSQINYLEERIDNLENTKVNTELAFISRIRELSGVQAQIKSSFTHKQTRDASFFEPIAVSHTKTLPKDKLMVFGGILAGMLLGIFIVWAVNLRKA